MYKKTSTITSALTQQEIQRLSRWKMWLRIEFLPEYCFFAFSYYIYNNTNTTTVYNILYYLIIFSKKMHK